MSNALRGINTTGNKTSYDIKPNTVEGLQQSIHNVIRDKFPTVDKGGGNYRWEVLFDTKTASCIKCDKCFITHPTRSQVAHFCTDEACWKKKTEEHKEKAAAEAKAKMQEEVTKRAIHQIAHADSAEEEMESRAAQRDKALDAEAERVKAETEEENSAVVPAEVLTQVPAEMQTIPDEVMEKAKAAAGTRAEVLDLIDICTGQIWNRQMKQGFVLLSREIRMLDEPEECLERCTKGFHYAFDSQNPEDKKIFVCSDPKCLALKKGAYTRKVNAEGLARKNAERKAVQEAVEGAKNRPRGLLLLFIYTQLKGSHISTYSHDGCTLPAKRLWDKLYPGTKADKRTDVDLMKKLDKLDEDVLRKLTVEMCFYYLASHDNTGSYEIKTEVPLRLMGVELEEQFKEKPAAAGKKGNDDDADQDPDTGEGEEET
jgi:hypothetical protein